MSSITKGEFTKLSDTVRSLENVSAVCARDIEFLQMDGKDSRQLSDRLRDQISSLQMQNAVLTAAFDDFKKRWDESDRRRWTVYGVMIAAGLSFVANLILLFLKR